ncbi:MAG TPA: hypothetical protein VGZ22_22470 [Isosphaeraceae bacterium]|jgi:hypothetical protein|nr:hypothetical protein [Isosphaeraceae bacterium]
MTVRVRRLRLVGVSQNYDVDFLGDNSPRPLSVIAGEISTGKSSVLEFIDFCLGASNHPKHPEVQRQVRSALLEVDLSGETFVIERGLDGGPGTAFVHACPIDLMATPHGKTLHPIAPPSDPQSLSTLLLEHCGLAGISLREAPSKAESRTDPLSFRDVMWLSFLSNHRMDGRQLLHETNHMQNIKLKQVIDVIFGIHDDQLAQLAESIIAALDRRREMEAEIKALDRFLVEQDVPTVIELEAVSARVAGELASIDAELEAVSASMRASSSFADQMREAYATARRVTAAAGARVRDRETLLSRLLPLRGQYTEDEKKLIFYQEAKSLFDPLRVTVCPSCLQPLEKPASIENGGCSLCGRSVAVGDAPIDVAAELNSTRTRRREIDRYISEVEGDLLTGRQDLARASAAEGEIRGRLDAIVAQALAPFVAQRDDLLRRRGQLSSANSETDRLLKLHAGLSSRHETMAKLDETLGAMRERQRRLQEHQPSRESVVGDLSDRFARTLRDFSFPKLDDPAPPFIDTKFVPYVRGNSYREIGSTGALTLISMAWFFAIFERAVQTGAPHPGFLMVDSPQKNLTPRADSERQDEFADPAIVSRVWEHIIAMTEAAPPGSMQMIVVDNAPPPAAGSHVVVRYGGPLGPNPYGLIENEVG